MDSIDPTKKFFQDVSQERRRAKALAQELEYFVHPKPETWGDLTKVRSEMHQTLTKEEI